MAAKKASFRADTSAPSALSMRSSQCARREAWASPASALFPAPFEIEIRRGCGLETGTAPDGLLRHPAPAPGSSGAGDRDEDEDEDNNDGDVADGEGSCPGGPRRQAAAGPRPSAAASNVLGRLSEKSGWKKTAGTSRSAWIDLGVQWCDFNGLVLLFSPPGGERGAAEGHGFGH